MKEARDKRVINDKAQMSTYYMEKYKEAIDRGIQFIELENPIEEPESGKKGRLKLGKARALAKRLKDHKDALCRFFYDFMVPFDNNLLWCKHILCSNC